jgi:hypothetical protein
VEFPWTQASTVGTRPRASRWARVHSLIISKDHLTVEGKQTIRQIKAEMKQSLTIFLWSHLDSFTLKPLIDAAGLMVH